MDNLANLATHHPLLMRNLDKSLNIPQNLSFGRALQEEWQGRYTETRQDKPIQDTTYPQAVVTVSTM